MREGKRWVVPGERRTHLESFEIPRPGPRQMIVRTEASLVSAGTELAIYTGIHQGLTNPHVTWPKYPQAMGYMAVARVEEVGEGVELYRVGNRLLTSTGHASHVLVDLAEGGHRRTWQLPEEVPAHNLVLARMGKTAITAVCQAGITVAQSVAVVGLGIVGQVALRLFLACGAWPVVGVDPVSMRRTAARRGGAIGCIDPREGAPAESIRELLPDGADIVVDATGRADALPGAMALAREAGTVVVLGSPRGTAPDVDFYTDLHRRSLRVVGAHDSGIGIEARPSFPFTNDRVVPALVEWVRSKRVPVDDLITHHVGADALPAMYQGLLERPEEFLGVVLDWKSEG